MFEAVVIICLGLEGGPCHDQLLPGHEAQTLSACEASLDARAPDPGALAKMRAKGAPFCQPAGPVLEVVEVASGAFIHVGRIEEPDKINRGDVSNLGFIIGDDSVAVVDSGGARWIGEALWRAIRARTDKPVRYIILTHPHPDHVFGAAPFALAGAEVVAHSHLPRALADRQANYMESFTNLIGVEAFLGTRVPPVTMRVDGEMTLDLGNRVLRLHSWPVAHTTADLTVLDEDTGTLLAGDLVFDRHVPALDGSVIGWRKVLAELEKDPVERVVPGHGGPVLAWPDALFPMERYLATLENDTRQAIERGERLGFAVEHIAASEAASWALFDAFNARNATVAYTELEWE